MTELAPILLFVYNRPDHLTKTISALKSCKLAAESELYIFSDGPKPSNSQSKIEVEKVRDLIHSIDGFKQIHIIKKESNIGLANSIISGVNYVFTKHSMLITLEDDVIVGQYFLEYMNNNLPKYEATEKILMISGYLFNLPFSKKRKSNFFLATGTTQAWATWKHKWEAIDFNPKDYKKLKTNRLLSFKFNMFGSINYSKMLISQMEDNNISSWAIRLRWHFFKKNGLTLFPSQNLIRNTGWDGSGNHCATNNIYNDSSNEMHTKCDSSPKKVKAKFLDSFLLIFFFYKIKVVGFINYRFKKAL